jgi:hypothetical protein
MNLDQTVLKAYLHYNPDTGVFTARKACGIRPAGRVLGSKSRHGYVQITVAKRTYTAQRLAWFYAYGEYPDGVIDHINRARDDNRLCNLRNVNRSQNAFNTIAVRGQSGIRGVSPTSPSRRKHCKKLWQAHISVNGKRKELGRFYTLEEAAAARKTAEKEIQSVGCGHDV